jgi:hypothetical protein
MALLFRRFDLHITHLEAILEQDSIGFVCISVPTIARSSRLSIRPMKLISAVVPWEHKSEEGIKDRVRMRILVFQMLERHEFLEELLTPTFPYDPKSQGKWL